jgi:hypothetical protein
VAPTLTSLSERGTITTGQAGQGPFLQAGQVLVISWIPGSFPLRRGCY